MSTKHARRPSGAAFATTPGEDEALRRPLDWGLVARLYQRTKPHSKTRNRLLCLVTLRSIQLPTIGWAVAALLSGPIAARDARGTVLGVAGFLGLVVFTELSFHFRSRLALELGEAIVHDLRNDLFEHLLRMPMSYFNSRTGRVGRLISRVVSDVDNVRLGVQDVAFVAVVQLGTMLGAAAFMLYYDRILFLLVLAMVPILWKLLEHFRSRLSRAHRVMHESFSRVTSSLAESVSGVRVTQGFVREDLQGGLFRQLVEDHGRNNMAVVRQSSVFLPLLEFNGQMFVATVLAVGGARTLGHRMDLAALVQFLFLANLFFNAIPVLGNLWNQALMTMAASERVFKLLDTPPAWVDSLSALPPPRLRGKVEMIGVSFAYDPGRPVLHGIDLVVEPGTTVALVGPTGGGKTTFLGLLAKLHLPTMGTIRIDDLDMVGLSGTGLRRQMGVVPQSNFLFSGTVLDNIRLGRPDATDDDIAAAARTLGVLDLVQSLPAGLATHVGERGAGLSLGQRQVVCFLRALLADPRLLLLDEATSAVDSLTELRLQSALRTLLKGRTAFIVAHRLSTVREATLVLVIDGGRIVERGTHTSLLAQGGVYAGLHQSFARAV